MEKLSGKMGVVIDLITRLPVAIWVRENPKASDVNFEYVVADLYGKRWRIEEAFNTVKRLLGLG